jgi:hypothetical protein
MSITTNSASRPGGWSTAVTQSDLRLRSSLAPCPTSSRSRVGTRATTWARCVRVTQLTNLDHRGHRRLRCPRGPSRCHTAGPSLCATRRRHVAGSGLAPRGHLDVAPPSAGPSPHPSSVGPVRRDQSVEDAARELVIFGTSCWSGESSVDGIDWPGRREHRAFEVVVRYPPSDCPFD